MISYKVEQIIEELYKKCNTPQDIIELKEEIQSLNNSISAGRWTDLTSDDYIER